MLKQALARIGQSSAARKVGALVTLAAVSGMASAQTATGTMLDFSGATSEVTTAIGGLVALGGAVFLLHLGIKSTKWGRKAL